MAATVEALKKDLQQQQKEGAGKIEEAIEMADLRAEVEVLRQRSETQLAENEQLRQRSATQPTAKVGKDQRDEIAALKSTVSRLRSSSGASSSACGSNLDVRMTGSLQKLSNGVLGCNKVWAKRRVTLHNSGLLIWVFKVGPNYRVE